MKRVVVDTSVMLAMVGADGDARRALAARRVIDVQCQAPELLLIECAHVLGKLVRRKRLDALTAVENMQCIESLVNVHTTVASPVRYMSIAMNLNHSAYDVRFLVLAEHLRLPLLTADEVFAEKVRRAGFDVPLETLSGA